LDRGFDSGAGVCVGCGLAGGVNVELVVLQNYDFIKGRSVDYDQTPARPGRSLGGDEW
jgi:hypothetical protein